MIKKRKCFVCFLLFCFQMYISLLLQLNPRNRLRLRSMKVADRAKLRAPEGLAVFMVLGRPSSLTA